MRNWPTALFHISPVKEDANRRNYIPRKKNGMTKQEKAKSIAPWINPAKWITVVFNDVTGLNAEVFGCTDSYLLFQEAFPI
ncbi:MAG: hypothetical protein NPIRA06_27320 [Nitrospirales bacterium]|nr:MAG: hypothetical protein NPIRA06_27320 [Nitrospirales bacterium]